MAGKTLREIQRLIVRVETAARSAAWATESHCLFFV